MEFPLIQAYLRLAANQDAGIDVEHMNTSTKNTKSIQKKAKNLAKIEESREEENEEKQTSRYLAHETAEGAVIREVSAAANKPTEAAPPTTAGPSEPPNTPENIPQAAASKHQLGTPPVKPGGLVIRKVSGAANNPAEAAPPADAAASEPPYTPITQEAAASNGQLRTPPTAPLRQRGESTNHSQAFKNRLLFWQGVERKS